MTLNMKMKCSDVTADNPFVSVEGGEVGSASLSLPAVTFFLILTAAGVVDEVVGRAVLALAAEGVLVALVALAAEGVFLSAPFLLAGVVVAVVAAPAAPARVTMFCTRWQWTVVVCVCLCRSCWNSNAVVHHQLVPWGVERISMWTHSCQTRDMGLM